MFRMGVMHTAIGRKNDPLPLAISPHPQSRNLLFRIRYVKQLQQKVKFIFWYGNNYDYWKRLFTDTVSVNKMHLTDTVFVNKVHLTDTVSVNMVHLTDTVSVNMMHLTDTEPVNKMHLIGNLSVYKMHITGTGHLDEKYIIGTIYQRK